MTILDQVLTTERPCITLYEGGNVMSSAICVTRRALSVMSRGTQISWRVEQEVRRLVRVEGVTSKAQIYRHLEDNDFLDAGGRPSKSTIDRLVNNLTSSDVSEPWSFAEADPEEARFVLDVILCMFTRSDGRVWLTKDVAGWVARLRQVAPDMPAPWAYALAVMYQPGGIRVADVPLLDLLVALRAWNLEPEPHAWNIAVNASDDSPELPETFKEVAEALKLIADIILDLVQFIEDGPLRMSVLVARARAARSAAAQ